MFELTPNMKQWWVCGGAALSVAGHGMALAFPALLLPALRARNSDISLDLHTAAWLASCAGLAQAGGVLLSAALMERYGRRAAHLAMTAPALLPWLLIYAARDAPTLMLARLIQGIAMSSVPVIDSTIVGEYTSPENRGMFLTLKTAAVCFGNTIMHAMGFYLHWRTAALLSTVPFVLFVGNCCTWPESPAWLLARSRFQESEEAFYWLRGHGRAARRELRAMTRAQQQTTRGSRVVKLLAKFRRRDVLRPLMVSLVAVVMMEFSGRHMFPMFAPDILARVVGGAHVQHATLAVDALMCAAVACACPLSRALRRRTLLFGSGLASLVVLACFCFQQHLAAHGWLPAGARLPLALLALYYVLVNLGCVPVGVGLMGELFPLAHREAAAAAAGVLLSLPLLLATLPVPLLLATAGAHGTLALFGVVVALSLLLLYFTLPETSGRSLHEIEEFFRHGAFLDHADDEQFEMVKDKPVEKVPAMV